MIGTVWLCTAPGKPPPFHSLYQLNLHDKAKETRTVGHALQRSWKLGMNRAACWLVIMRAWACLCANVRFASMISECCVLLFTSGAQTHVGWQMATNPDSADFLVAQVRSVVAASFTTTLHLTTTGYNSNCTLDLGLYLANTRALPADNEAHRQAAVSASTLEPRASSGNLDTRSTCRSRPKPN